MGRAVEAWVHRDTTHTQWPRCRRHTAGVRQVAGPSGWERATGRVGGGEREAGRLEAEWWGLGPGMCGRLSLGSQAQALPRLYWELYQAVQRLTLRENISFGTFTPSGAMRWG